MNRRTFVRQGLIGGAGLASVSLAISETSIASSSSNLPPPAFELDELTIADLQSGMASGKYSAHSLARKYLDRFDDIDKRGPAINSVIELNPDALPIATELDKILPNGRPVGLKKSVLSTVEWWPTMGLSLFGQGHQGGSWGQEQPFGSCSCRCPGHRPQRSGCSPAEPYPLDRQDALWAFEFESQPLFGSSSLTISGLSSWSRSRYCWTRLRL